MKDKIYYHNDIKTCVTIALTHWDRVTHICVGNLTIIGPDNGLSPGRRQAIIWPNAGILLFGPRPWGTNFSEISIGIQTFSFEKMHLKLSSAKWRPFCLGLNVLSQIWLCGTKWLVVMYTHYCSTNNCNNRYSVWNRPPLCKLQCLCDLMQVSNINTNVNIMISYSQQSKGADVNKRVRYHNQWQYVILFRLILTPDINCAKLAESYKFYQSSFIEW